MVQNLASQMPVPMFADFLSFAALTGTFIFNDQAESNVFDVFRAGNIFLPLASLDSFEHMERSLNILGELSRQ